MPPAPQPDVEVAAAAKRLLQRLDTVLSIVEEDSGRASCRVEPPGSSPVPSSAPSSSGQPAAAAVAPPDVEEFRKGMVPPREPLASHLDSYAAEVPWKLPAGLKARVAPHFLMQIYGAYPLSTESTKCLVREKQLEGHHIEHEMQVPALALDSQVKSDSNFTNPEASEILCRRVYGIRRAFSAVKSRMDWPQPKGQGAHK